MKKLLLATLALVGFVAVSFVAAWTFDHSSPSGDEVASTEPAVEPELDPADDKLIELAQNAAPDVEERVAVPAGPSDSRTLRFVDATAGGTPIQGLEVNVRRKGEWHSTMAAEDATDADGVLTIRPNDHPRFRGATALEVNSKSLDWIQGWVPLKQEGEGTIQVIELRRVARIYLTLEGAVSGPARGMLAQAWATLSDGTHVRARRNVGGRHRLDLDPMGTGSTHVDIFAVAPNQGARLLSHVEVPAPGEEVELTLTLESHGELRGRVLGADGSPAAGVNLSLRCEWSMPENVDGSERMTSYRTEQQERLGSLHARATTDDNGQFHAVGLGKGDWHVDALIDGPPEQSTQLTESPVPSDGEPLTLRFERAHIVVSASGVEHAFMGPSSWGRSERSEWADTPQFRVRHASLEHLTSWQSDDVQAKFVCAGEAVYDVEEGRDYLVSIEGGPFEPAVQRVSVPKGVGRIDVALKTGPTVELATLILAPKDAPHPKFRSLARGSLMSPATYRLRHQKTGLVLVDADAPYDFNRSSQARGDGRKEFVAQVPAGSYDVEIEGTDSYDLHHGTLMSARRVAEWSGEVTLAPGETKRLSPTLPTGARVKLVLLGDGQASEAQDHIAIRGRFRMPANVPSEFVRPILERRGAKRCLLPIQGYSMHQTSAFGVREMSDLWLGYVYESDPIGTGPHTLVLEHSDGRTKRVELNLVSGEIHEVIVRFPSSERPPVKAEGD